MRYFYYIIKIMYISILFWIPLSAGNVFAADVMPDIKANNSDGPIILFPGNSLSITLELDAGDSRGTHADWFLYCSTPVGSFSYHAATKSWLSAPTIASSYQGALFSFGSTELLNVSGLRAGTYTCYFAVDSVVNGELDREQMFYDSVVINVKDATDISGLNAILLSPDAGTSNNELVNLGIPFPEGLLFDADNVRILDEQGQEVPAYVEKSIAWHTDDSVRAVKVQFFADMSAGAKTYSFVISAPRSRRLDEQNYDLGTIAAKEGFHVPKVLATLLPEWMTLTLITEPQTILHETAFDDYVTLQWQWAKDVNYGAISNWLFDRVSTIAKLYVRSGNPEYLKEAFNSYRFYIDKIKTTGSAGFPDCAGGWEYKTKNPCDSKYVYIESILLMLALTGDDTQHDESMVNLMVEAYRTGGWTGDPLKPYSAANANYTERVNGLRVSAFADAYALTGKTRYFNLMQKAVDNFYTHQTANPDGRGNDGCWRHSWALHEGGQYPGNIADDRRCSPWMSVMIIGGLYKAYTITHDERIEEMVLGFADFMENYGWISQEWLDHPDAIIWTNSCQNGAGTIAGYSASSVASIDELVKTQNTELDNDMHNPDLLLPVAWAWSLTTDIAKKHMLEDRIALIDNWFNADCAGISKKTRSFNWQNRYGALSQWILANN